MACADHAAEVDGREAAAVVADVDRAVGPDRCAVRAARHLRDRLGRTVRVHPCETRTEHLDDDHLVEMDAVPIEGGCWRVTIVAYDYPGELSLICGLLFVYGFSIYDGHVFTYEPLAWAINKGDPDFLNFLNNFLRQTKGDGFYDLMYKKWITGTKWKGELE